MRTKSLLTIALAAAGMMYGASVFAAGDSPAADSFGSGKITFTGTITNSPCDIAPGDDAITVPFGQVSYRKLNANDSKTESKPFTIHLQNCGFDANDSGPDKAVNPKSAGKMSKVTVSFSGTGNDTIKAYTGSGTAKNIGVQLLMSNNSTIIEPNTPMPDTDAQQLQVGNNELTFYARLVALGAPATSGDFSIPVTYTLKYQ
ncbi:fimbrial protein [Salmonella enterica]|nr:fimbrial protein [Salmonella enterica]EHF6859862.1 fimbrial protein [Salmonella enterica subsp. enterica serovar Panama]